MKTKTHGPSINSLLGHLCVYVCAHECVSMRVSTWGWALLRWLSDYVCMYVCMYECFSCNHSVNEIILLHLSILCFDYDCSSRFDCSWIKPSTSVLRSIQERLHISIPFRSELVYHRTDTLPHRARILSIGIRAGYRIVQTNLWIWFNSLLDPPWTLKVEVRWSFWAFLQGFGWNLMIWSRFLWIDAWVDD